MLEADHGSQYSVARQLGLLHADLAKWLATVQQQLAKREEVQSQRLAAESERLAAAARLMIPAASSPPASPPAVSPEPLPVEANAAFSFRDSTALASARESRASTSESVATVGSCVSSPQASREEAAAPAAGRQATSSPQVAHPGMNWSACAGSCFSLKPTSPPQLLFDVTGRPVFPRPNSLDLLHHPAAASRALAAPITTSTAGAVPAVYGSARTPERQGLAPPTVSFGVGMSHQHSPQHPLSRLAAPPGMASPVGLQQHAPSPQPTLTSGMSLIELAAQMNQRTMVLSREAAMARGEGNVGEMQTMTAVLGGASMGATTATASTSPMGSPAAGLRAAREDGGSKGKKLKGWAKFRNIF